MTRLRTNAQLEALRKQPRLLELPLTQHRHLDDRCHLAAYNLREDRPVCVEEYFFPLRIGLLGLNFEASWISRTHFVAWRGLELIYNGPVLNVQGLPQHEFGGAA